MGGIGKMPLETGNAAHEPPRSEVDGRAKGAGTEGYYLRLTGTGLLYFAAGIAGLAVPFTTGNVSPVWPASGVALACLLLFGWRCWPAVAVAAFLVNFFSPIPAMAAVGVAVGNTVAALTGAFLLRRRPGFRPSLTRVREALALIVLAAALSSTISASIGAGVLFFYGVKPWTTFGAGWLIYYLGDAMGILLVAPALLTARKLWRPISGIRAFEFCGLLLLAALASALLFDGHLRFVEQHNVLVLLLFPLIPWAAIRFGVPGVALSNLLIGSITVIATARGYGPFSGDTPFINALLLQLFLATLSISGILLSAVIAERRRTEAERGDVIVSQRLRAEKEAATSRMELQSVLDNSPALIYMKDEAGRYVFVNRRWTEFFRKSVEDARGKTDFELFPEVSARQFVANDREVMASGQALEFEEQSELPDGMHIYQSVKVGLKDGNGRLYALCGISTDITERKAKEESLRQVHRALRVLSYCNSAMVHATDEQALLNEVCRVAVGPAGYLLAWVGRAEHDEARTVRPIAFAGPAEGFLDRIHVSWADNEYGRGSLGPAIRTGKPVVVHRLREQPTFSVWRDALASRNLESVVAVPLREGDSVWGALAVYAAEPDAFDSSEVELIVELGQNLAHGIASLRARKQRTEAMAELMRARLELEERVRQRTAELVQAKDAAESADRLKSAFLATMSHELRTPLNSIIGFTGIVLQGLAGPLNGEQKKQLGMVQNSARHLLALINDVLDISKIEAGQLEIQCAPFSLPEAIRKAVTVVSPLAQRKGIALRTEIAPEIDTVLGDQRRTEQILLNLLGNAIKFTDRGEVCVHCVRDRQWLVTAIRDTGVGIDPQHQQSIFEPFRQADTGLTRKHEGTGLGLSICKRLLDRLGGSISVESAPGQGSTFTVRLPLETEACREQNNPGD
jgi:PAS domain S-box-containing protein